MPQNQDLSCVVYLFNNPERGSTVFGKFSCFLLLVDLAFLCKNVWQLGMSQMTAVIGLEELFCRRIYPVIKLYIARKSNIFPINGYLESSCVQKWMRSILEVTSQLCISRLVLAGDGLQFFYR